MNIESKEYPKWGGCSAAVRPLNRANKHLRDDRIYLYARAFVQERAEKRLSHSCSGGFYQDIAASLDWLKEESADTRKRLIRAATTPSRLSENEEHIL